MELPAISKLKHIALSIFDLSDFPKQVWLNKGEPRN